MRRPKWLHLPAVKDKRRLISRLQSLAIALLLVSAAVLSLSRAGFALGGEINRYGGIERGDSQHRDYSAAAEPMSVVVTPENGVHASAMYESRELEEYYNRYSAPLAEALGSAGEPEAVAVEEWESALRGPGVYFDYYTDFQLSSLAIWLGSAMDSGAAVHTARRLCLSLSDGAVVLYYLHARSGEVYRCSTQLSVTELSGRVEESTPDGTRFVFELDNRFEDVDAYAVLTSGEIDVHTVSGANSLDQSRSDELMNVFGINSNLAQGYPEADGTDVYLEGLITLRLGSNGVLRFSNRSDIPDTASDLSPSDAVELTRRILSDTVGLESGVAQLRLSYIYLDLDTHEYTLRYDYAIDGLTVSLAGRECAAEFKLVGATLTSADIIFRSYSYTGGTERPLPAVLAAALVQAEGGGEPRLAYIDTLGGVSADWIRV